jgi:hypothetical protein
MNAPWLLVVPCDLTVSPVTCHPRSSEVFFSKPITMTAFYTFLVLFDFSFPYLLNVELEFSIRLEVLSDFQFYKPVRQNSASHFFYIRRLFYRRRLLCRHIRLRFQFLILAVVIWTCFVTRSGYMNLFCKSCVLVLNITRTQYLYLTYRGGVKSLDWPGRKQATEREDFLFHISCL